MDQRTRRSPARFLAPLALIAVVVALLAIVSGSPKNGSTGSSSSSTSAGTTTSARHKARTTPTSGKTGTTTGKLDANPKSYVVKVGDSLSTIADKTGVPLDTIVQLNPAVDPNAMTAGQKIRLR